MKVRRLVALVRKLRQRNGQPDSELLNLPLDLVYNIFDELQLHEKILFSQSCRTLWYAFRQKCSVAIRKATNDERLESLALLGDILPDRWLCTFCRALHLVDRRDIPVTGYEKYYRPCQASEDMWSGHHLMTYYAIAFRHIQLAMKYTRLPDIHQIYRKKILKRFTICLRRFYSMKLDFFAEPKIISNRFLLMFSFAFSETITRLSYETVSQAKIDLCPHLYLGEVRVGPANPLETALRAAFDMADSHRRPHEAFHSCHRCPTDFSIAVKEKKTIITNWMDLGAGMRPEDPFWRSHLELPGHTPFGPDLSFEHGSVRELYHSSGTRSWIK